MYVKWLFLQDVSGDDVHFSLSVNVLVGQWGNSLQSDELFCSLEVLCHEKSLSFLNMAQTKEVLIGKGVVL